MRQQVRAEVRLGVATQARPRIIPADDFVRDGLYPGYTPSFGTQPFVHGFSLEFDGREIAEIDLVGYCYRRAVARE
jgi:hypothetical protein